MDASIVLRVHCCVKRLLCRGPHRVNALCIHGRRLSVWLSHAIPTSRTEGHGKQKVDRKQAVTPFRVDRSRSRSLSRLLPWPKSNRIFGTGRLTNLKLGKPREHDELYYWYWRARCPPTWKLWVVAAYVQYTILKNTDLKKPALVTAERFFFYINQ